jgi:D-glycero-alpha-D-manno-heptose 1-phosphate guanylyltransferase
MLNHNHDLIAVILAGGFGTRVKHLLPDLPKPMAPVAGKPFVEWIIRYLHSQRLTQVILATGYLGEVIEAYFTANPIPGVNLNSYRETKALGTGGGFVNIVNQSKQKPAAWLITNGDSLIVADLSLLLPYLDDKTVSGVILGLSMPDASRYGSLVYDQEENLISFAEKKPGAGVINAGVYLLRHDLINKFPPQIPLSFEEEVFPSLLQQGVKIKVHIVDAPFLDIGTPSTLIQAEQFIQNNLPMLTLNS